MNGYANSGWMEHLQEFVPSRKCNKPDDKNSPWTYLLWFQNLKTLSIGLFASYKVSCSCVFWFDWMETMFCKCECDYGPRDHHWVNQIWFFGPFFHQKFLCMTKCDGNWYLPSDSHSNKWRSCSQCMSPKVHIMDVSVCSTCISQVEGVYMDPIRVEANLWQTQGNLVGTNVSEWMT